jgi:Uma2 family endonuclease
MNVIALFLPIATPAGGRLFTAPLDVFVGGANPVEPDLIVPPERLHLMNKRGIEGAPDLLIEMLSPSNPEHDRITKRALYERGGVREYWCVSPEAATIEVLTLDGSRYQNHLRDAGDGPVTFLVLPDLSFPASTAFSATSVSQAR